MNHLEEKFNKFILSRSSNESIDSLPNELFKNKKADYLVFSRSLIFEVKHLESDRSEFINRKCSELALNDPKFPDFYGKVSIDSLIDAHDDSRKFSLHIRDYMGMPIRDLIRSANLQIRDTKIALDKNNSTGVLVLLNDSVPMYTGEFIYQQVSRFLSKKRSDGSFEREHIEVVWFINEFDTSEYISSAYILIGPSLKNENVVAAFEQLKTMWAGFNNAAIANN